MTYTQVFGGTPILPSGQSYLALSFSTDLTLFWRVEQQIGGDNVVAEIMDLTAEASSLNVIMPDATLVSEGALTQFVNVGSNTFTVQDADGGTIVSIDSGDSWIIYLRDNSTTAGTWGTYQLGASTSAANAADLAGAGLEAESTKLNTIIASVTYSSTPVNLDNSAQSLCNLWTGGAGVMNLPDPATVGANWYTTIRNGGTGDLAVTPAGSEDIDGEAAALTFVPGDSAFIFTDGTDWYTIGFGQTPTIEFDYISINIAGSGDYTLSGTELNRISYEFTGALTGDRKIIVPNTIQQYWVNNQTSGSFSLTIGTAAQTSDVEIAQGFALITYCDGTQVVNAHPIEGDLVTSVNGEVGDVVLDTDDIDEGSTNLYYTNARADARIAAADLGDLSNVSETGAATGEALTYTGSGWAPSASAAVLESRTLTAGEGISGGGDLSADRSFALDLSELSSQTTTSGTDRLIFDNSGNNEGITVSNFMNQFIGVVEASSFRVTDAAGNSLRVQFAEYNSVSWGSVGVEVFFSFPTTFGTAPVAVLAGWGNTGAGSDSRALQVETVSTTQFGLITPAGDLQTTVYMIAIGESA